MPNSPLYIESQGIVVNGFHIPQFTLNEGEILVIHLLNGPHAHDLKMGLAAIFTGSVKNEDVIVNQPFNFVDHFREHRFRRWFWPVTVGEYLRKNADPCDPLATKIYDYDYISEKTEVNSLAGNPRRLLAVSAMLTRSKDIVFDLAGTDPAGASAIYELVKGRVKEGGSAILLDWADDMKEDCTRFVAAEWVGDIQHRDI